MTQVTNKWRAETARTAIEAFSATQGVGHAREDEQTRAKDLASNLIHFLRLECGMDIDEAVYAVNEAVSRAKVEAAEDEEGTEEEPVLRKYGVRLWATFRGECEITVEAASFEAAIEAARKLDHNDHNFTFTDTVEGDQTAQVFGPDDDNPDDDDEWGGDGVEVDMRGDGDPFSWTACHITKELAALHDKGWESHTIVLLISEAHRACNKITGGQEG